MASVHEQLSEQFYKWESRGRGWQVFSEPVYPEPPFQPFIGHYLPEAPAVDDGRRPTFLSSLFRKISQPQQPPPVIPETEDEPEPQILIRDALVELQTFLPADFDITREAFEQFLLNLSRCREPVAFELLGVPNRVVMQFVAHPNDAPLVRRQLQAHFPGGMFNSREGTLEAAWDACNGDDALVVEFGLAHEFMLPLQSGKLDPFVGIVGALSELKAGELGLFQVLFQPTLEPWAESIVSSVTHADGKPFFVNQPELAGAAENKVSRPLFAAVVRIAIRSDSFERTLELARDLAGSLRVFAHPQGNELIPLENVDYRTRDGVLWRDTQIARVLSETSAKGVYYFNRYRKEGTWRVADKPESEWGKVICDPIVPEMLWRQVNTLIEEQLKSWKKPGRLPVQVFGNLAHCACGNKMYVRSNCPKYVCRKCQNKIPIVDLDAIFHEELKAFFADHARIAHHLKEANHNLAEKQALLAAHERKITKLREEMARTHRLYLDGSVTSQGFGEFYKPAEEQLNQLVAELPKLQAEVDFLKVNTLSADEVLSEAQTLYARWPQLPTEDKRKIAESIVEKILIGDGEIDITLSYLPSSEELTKTQQQLRGPG